MSSFHIHSGHEDMVVLAKAIIEAERHTGTRVAIRGTSTGRGIEVSVYDKSEVPPRSGWVFVNRLAWINNAKMSIRKRLEPQPGIFRFAKIPNDSK